MILAKNIKLRALNNNDKNKILEWVNNPNLKLLTGGVFPVSEFEHSNWFESRVLDSINKLFAIEVNEDLKTIGVIGLKNTDLVNRNSEIYVYIGEQEYWGRGYGSQAIYKLIEFCFNELNLHRVYLNVFDYNERAISSYKKVGFKVEGILKDSVYKNGKYHNKVVMAILKHEFI